jgi:hypothetical protein
MRSGEVDAMGWEAAERVEVIGWCSKELAHTTRKCGFIEPG